MATATHNFAFSSLCKAVENAFCEDARPATLEAVQSFGLKIEDIERVVGSVLVEYLPGGAFGKGREFATSALSLYQMLGQPERQAFKAFYEDAVTQGKWKIVEPVLSAGIAPAADSAHVYSTAERYRVELQWGGFQRTVFVDVVESKRQQLRNLVLDHNANAEAGTISREMRVMVGTFVQQHLSAGIHVSPNQVLTWN